jgi:hypothetical protein
MRYRQPEQKSRPDGEGLVRLDECPALGDVLGVIGKEGVQLFVIDPQLDRSPHMLAIVGSLRFVHAIAHA